MAVILNNYGIQSIEFAPEGRLVLRGKKILLWKGGSEIICAAGKIILELEDDFDNLIDAVQKDMRKIFNLNSLLHNMISKDLHSCCVAKTGWDGKGCVSKTWNENILTCFLNWARRKTVEKRSSEFLSYMIGDAFTLDEMAAQLSQSLKSYNDNFQKISRHNQQVDKNLNALARMCQHLSSYEKFN